MTPSPESVQDIAAAYVARVDDLYGLYLDATEGFKRNVDEVVGIQQESAKTAAGQTYTNTVPWWRGSWLASWRLATLGQ